MLNRIVLFSDSILYVERKGGPTVELGNRLGDWVDEIDKDYGEAAEISEYVSTGAKSYAFNIEKPDGTVLFHISMGYCKRNHLKAQCETNHS